MLDERTPQRRQNNCWIIDLSVGNPPYNINQCSYSRHTVRSSEIRCYTPPLQASPAPAARTIEQPNVYSFSSISDLDDQIAPLVNTQPPTALQTVSDPGNAAHDPTNPYLQASYNAPTVRGSATKTAHNYPSLAQNSSLRPFGSNLLSEGVSAARSEHIARRSASPSSIHSSDRSSYVSPEPWQLFSEEEPWALQRLLESLTDLAISQNE